MIILGLSILFSIIILGKRYSLKKKYFYLRSNKNFFIKNLNRGLICIGGAGSGKTYSIMKPLLAYCIKNKGCLTFDPKGELTEIINSTANKYKKPIVNFSLDDNLDPINPITLCEDKSDIIEFSNYFLSGIIGIPKDDTAKYFFNSAKGILTGTIIFLRNENEKFATIPHVIAFFLTLTTEEIISLLSSNDEAKRASTILNTVKDNPKLLGSIMSTFSAYFSSMDTPKIFRNLITNDKLHLPNNTEKPCIINLVFNLQKRELYTPIYSSIVGLIIKKMNTPGQNESAVIIDEFTALSIPSFVNIPETARSNKIASCIAIQDISQLISRYGKEEASSIISNMGNQFLFRTTNPETLDHFERTLGKREVKNVSINKSIDFSFKSSKNEGLRERSIIQKEKIIKFKPGQVFGIIAEGNKKLIEYERVNGKHYLKRKKTNKILERNIDVNKVYNQVYSDIKNLILSNNSMTIKPKKFNL